MHVNTRIVSKNAFCTPTPKRSRVRVTRNTQELHEAIAEAAPPRRCCSDSAVAPPRAAAAHATCGESHAAAARQPRQSVALRWRSPASLASDGLHGCCYITQERTHAWLGTPQTYPSGGNAGQGNRQHATAQPHKQCQKMASGGDSQPPNDPELDPPMVMPPPPPLKKPKGRQRPITRVDASAEADAKAPPPPNGSVPHTAIARARALLIVRQPRGSRLMEIDQARAKATPTSPPAQKACADASASASWPSVDALATANAEAKADSPPPLIATAAASANARDLPRRQLSMNATACGQRWRHRRWREKHQ